MAKQEKGYLHIYAGDGKGKSTAATGLALRAAARQWRVLFVQFLKSGTSAELQELALLPTVTVVSGQKVAKFSFQMTPEEKECSRREISERLSSAFEAVWAGEVDILFLDETLGAIQAGLLNEEQLLQMLARWRAEAPGVEVVLTGRNPSAALIAEADYYSEIVMRKHPYESEGLGARPGIEF